MRSITFLVSRLVAAFVASSLLSYAAAAAQDADAGGTLKVTYQQGTDDRSDSIARSLRAMPLFDEIAKSVSDSVRLPHNLTATFRNCGEANAYYDPAKLDISMCYEMIAMFAETAAKNSESDQEISEHILGAGAFFFLHELGHALVHQLDLPITGREEDAVDEIATLIILNADDDDGQGAAMLASAAIQFDDLASKKQETKDLDFWDEHSLDAQRMYNVMCLVYGSNPQAYAELVGEGGLPQQRAQRCPADYKQRKRSWERLLKDSLKP